MNLVFMSFVVAAAPGHFTVLTCDGEAVEDDELVQALKLEVRRTSGAVTRCGDEWRFESEAFEPVVVDLVGTPAPLRARTFALAVQTGLTPLAPRPVSEAPLVSPRAAPARPSAVRSVPPVQVQLDLGFRLFVLPPTSAMFGFLARVMTKWRVWGGVELGFLEGGAKGYGVVGLLGVRVFEVPLGEWALVGELAVEVGTLAMEPSFGAPRSPGVLFGGWGLAGAQRVVSDEVTVQLAVRAGYDRAMNSELPDASASNLNHPFVGLQVGIRL